MKWFYLVGLLLLGVLSCKADTDNLQDITKSSEDSTEEFLNEIKDVLLQKCKAQGGEESIQKVTDTIKSVKECLKTNLPNNPISLHKTITDNSEAICLHNKRKDVAGCFDKLVEVFESCAADDEKYIAKFFFSAVEALLDYICSDDGTAAISLINDDTFDCLSKLIEQDNATDVCDDKFKFSKGVKPEEIFVTKDELCSDLSTVKTCYGDYIQQQCPKDKALKNALVGVIDAISTSC